MRTPDFGTNRELAQGYTARKWQSWDSTPRCDLQFLVLSVLFDDHFLTSFYKALGWALGDSAVHEKSACGLEAAGGDGHANKLFNSE